MEADKKALELARARFETGVDDRLSLVEAQATLQAVQSQAINLGVARAQFEHAIAVLVGVNPSQFSIPVKPLLTNAPPIPLGMPSGLLEREAGYCCGGAHAGVGECTDRGSVCSVLSFFDVERFGRFR